MKLLKRLATILLIIFIVKQLPAQSNFEPYFEDRTLRVDLLHHGNSKNESYHIQKYYYEPFFAGNPCNTIMDRDLGLYEIRLSTMEGKTIFKYNYSTLFSEWRTIDDAIEGKKKIFYETLRVPYPKIPVYIEIYGRGKCNRFTERILNAKFDPGSEKPTFSHGPENPNIIKFHPYGDPHYRLDFLFLSDGYLSDQLPEFIKDIRFYTSMLRSTEPFKNSMKKINITGVFIPSHDSGITEPDNKKFKRTAFGFSYNSLGLPRYVISGDMRNVHNASSLVPHDQIIVLVNGSRYGGGGIYNYLSCVAIKNNWAKYILIHELGHALGGLGDEYYTSNVSYNDFYPEGIEPWEPNLTRLLPLKDLKWVHLIKRGTPIPTPDNKNYHQEIGAFEGGGYVAKGIYRPSSNCIMYSFNSMQFCPVCRESIEKIIKHYTCREE